MTQFMRSTTATAALLTLLCVGIGGVAHANTYSITDLGTLVVS